MSQKESKLNNLFIFIALTYALSWFLWIPTALFGQNPTGSLWLIPYMLGGFGPSVAGVIMVYRSMHTEARRDFWNRVVDVRRISVGWHLLILLIFPTLFAGTFLINGLFGNPLPALETLALIAENPISLVGMLIIGIVAGPLSEELGWRGFMIDRLQTRWSPLVSSLILAPVWWAWHLPLFFMPGTTHYEWGFATPSFWLFLVGIVPLSVLLTWAYNDNRRSTLAAILLHFTYNVTLSLVHPMSFTVHLLHVALLSLTALGLALTRRPRL